jgi:hypothetical protein
MRKQCKEWKYRCARAEAALEELRMHLHQVGMSDPQVKRTALAYLKAEAEAYHARLEEAGNGRASDH